MVADAERSEVDLQHVEGGHAEARVDHGRSGQSHHEQDGREEGEHDTAPRRRHTQEKRSRAEREADSHTEKDRAPSGQTQSGRLRGKGTAAAAATPSPRGRDSPSSSLSLEWRREVWHTTRGGDMHASRVHSSRCRTGGAAGTRAAALAAGVAVVVPDATFPVFVLCLLSSPRRDTFMARRWREGGWRGEEEGRGGGEAEEEARERVQSDRLRTLNHRIFDLVVRNPETQTIKQAQ